MQPNEDKRTMQQKGFDAAYEAFFKFYQDALAKNPPPYEKVRLVLTTKFFDDLALQKIVMPIFDKTPSTIDDKRAIATAAYFDALTIHNRTAGIKFETVSVKDVVAGKGNY